MDDNTAITIKTTNPSQPKGPRIALPLKKLDAIDPRIIGEMVLGNIKECDGLTMNTTTMNTTIISRIEKVGCFLLLCSNLYFIIDLINYL